MEVEMIERRNFSVHDTNDPFSDYQDLREQEAAITPTLEKDDTLRIKVLDRCGMTCFFCHNEGTPVMNQSGFQAHRVSIYSSSNAIPFTQKDILNTDEASFSNALGQLHDSDLAKEVHWTGGEPTLAKQLPTLTNAARQLGYSVKMTSNGQSGERGLSELADAGLTGVNFSIFGTTPDELARTQGDVFRNNLELASRRLGKMDEAMIAATALGIKVKANIVISGEDDIDRGIRLLEKAPDKAHVRFQADTSDREPSLRAIYKLMRELGARPVARTIVAGCSIDNYDYETPEGRLVTFKQTRFSRLPGVCDNCPIDKAGECHEGYYGIRFYKDVADNYWLSPCIQKMDTAERLDDFLAEGGLGEKVSNYRNQDLARLQKQFAHHYNGENGQGDIDEH